MNVFEPPFSVGDFVEWIVPGLFHHRCYRGSVLKLARTPPPYAIRTGVVWMVEVECDDGTQREVTAQELRHQNAVDSIARLA